MEILEQKKKCEFCTSKSSKVVKTSSSSSVLSIYRIIKTRKKKKKARAMNAIEEDKVPELSRTCLGSRSESYSSLMTTLMRHNKISLERRSHLLIKFFPRILKKFVQFMLLSKSSSLRNECKG